MSNDPYRPMSSFPSEPVVEPRSAWPRIFVGCGLVVLVILLLGGAVFYSVWPELVAYGIIQEDLTKYRVAVEQSDLVPKVRDELVKDLDAVRLSIDAQSNFGFFQWISIDTEVEKILIDRRIDEKELAKLKTEIGRMKKVQNLEAQ